MNEVKGTIKPLNDKIFVYEMNFGESVTSSGIVIQSDNGKVDGIRPRWAKVWAVGPAQTDVSVGEWVLVEHGRWSRGIDVEVGAEVVTVRTIDNSAILLVSDQKPQDV